MAKKIYNIEGVQLGTASSHTRYGDKEDSLLITLPKTAKVSCKFTRNKLKAAPVKFAINKQKLKKITLQKHLRE